MRANFRPLFLMILLGIFFSKTSFSQTAVPGLIIRPATSATGKNTLDPDNASDGSALYDYTSKTSDGFGTADIYNSEIPYKPVKAFTVEPFGDLRRGPDHLYSDFVPDSSSNGYYMYFNGTNLFFRMRMGTIIPGAKGFSVLFDTDGKFGATGPNADPNYKPATTGVNGNPGFEVEIVLMTQTANASTPGIYVYNVDGIDNLTTAQFTHNNWQDYSQISIASTSDNGDPDFYIDWYIPFSDLTGLSGLGITSSTNLRMIPTTVMSPQGAIGGPKSDIYGLGDKSYKDPNAQYEAYINLQPSSKLTDWNTTSTESPLGERCTAVPTVDNITTTGAVTVTGTWTKTNATASASIATITIFKNGISTGVTATATSGIPWSTSSTVTVAGGDVITAKALAAGESQCYTSNSVTVKSCSTPTSVSGLAFSCANRRGLSGTMGSTTQVVKLYTMTASGPVLFATDGSITSPSGYLITYSGTTWAYNGSDNSGQADPCSGGPNDIPNGSYFYTVTEINRCESAPIVTATNGTPCLNLTVTATPTITQTTLYNTSTYLSGTTVSGASVTLYQNGYLAGSATATGTAYSFSSLKLATSDTLNLYAYISTSGCMSAVVSKIVATCVTTAPVITTNNTGNLVINQPITGTSSEVAGTTIRVYNSSNTLLATTQVLSNGSWTTSGATFSNGFAGLAAASTTYYATAQSTTCGVSASSTSISTGSQATSNTKCGTISAFAPSGNITSATTSITVSYTSGTSLRVTLYEDGQAIATQAALSGTGTVVFDVTNKLYAGNLLTTGILTVGVQEAGQEEVICPSTYLVRPNCTAPAAPNVSPAEGFTIDPGYTVTFTINAPTVSNAFYSISDSATGASLVYNGIWNTGATAFDMTTKAFNASSKAVIKASVMNLSGSSAGEVCTSSAQRSVSIQGNITLPVMLVTFTGRWAGEDVVLDWLTSHEFNSSHFEIERSADGVNYKKIGQTAVMGSMTGSTYSFTDGNPLEVGYYRLRSVDADGKYTYSKVVRMVEKLGAAVLNSVQPNPFASEFSISLSLPEQQTVKVMLLDASGRLMLQKEVSGNRGMNIRKFNELEHYNSGLYILKIMTEKEVLQNKLMKEAK